MANVIKYKGYMGSVNFYVRDQIFHGKLLGIHDVITYEGNTFEELQLDFKSAVNEYLEDCREMGKTLQKPFSGKFNVRIDPELHARAVAKAETNSQSLNSFVEEAIAKAV